MNKFTKFLLLAAAVRAATAYGAPVDVVNLTGRGLAILDAAAQGDGVTLNVKLQSAGVPEFGYAVLTTGTNNIPLRHGAADNLKLTAAFAQDGTRQIKEIALMLKKTGTITAGKKIWVTIEADVVGEPSGTPLATSALIEADSLGDYAFVTFPLAVPLDLADSGVYHVVLQGDYDASATNQIQWRAATVASGGNSNAFDAAWAAVDTNSFELYVGQYHFTDIVGGAFAEVGDAVSLQELAIPIDNIGGFVRAVATVAGGSATGASSLLLLGKPQYV